MHTINLELLYTESELIFDMLEYHQDDLSILFDTYQTVLQVDPEVIIILLDYLGPYEDGQDTPEEIQYYGTCIPRLASKLRDIYVMS